MLATLIYEDPEVYMLRVPFTNISTDATNVYIIKTGGEALVVDTGAPTKEGERILIDALNELEIDLASAHFFLTHFHLDHAGLIDRVAPPQARLYVSKVEYDRTRSLGKVQRTDDVYERFIVAGASDEESAMVKEMIQRDGDFVGEEHTFVFVGDNDHIKVGDYCFSVIDTSGHTAGHLSLFEPTKGLFFGGDHLLFVISPSMDFFNADIDSFEVYLQNLKKLTSLPITLFLPSHGDIEAGFSERINWLISHHTARCEEVLTLIKQNPGLRDIELVKSLHWNVPADCWEDISVIQRSIIIIQGLVILKHLEATGQIVKHEEEGKRTYYVK